MRFIWPVALLALLALAFTTEAQHTQKVDGFQAYVDDLTDATLDAVMDMSMNGTDAGTALWIVEFYAPWCGACTRFAPRYAELARLVHGAHGVNAEGKLAANPRVRVAKVNVDANPALSTRFFISRLPTMLLVELPSKKVVQAEPFRFESAQALFEWLEGGAWQSEPSPYLRLLSPFGPIARALGVLAGVGDAVTGNVAQALNAVGLGASPDVALFALAFAVALLFVGFLWASSRSDGGHAKDE